MTTYVGIDPGVHACGVAFCSGSTLRGAMWARADGTRDALAANVAEAVLVALSDKFKIAGSARDDFRAVVGIEFPEVTEGRARGNADTADLLELSYAIGRIEEAVHREVFNAHVVRVQVSTWKKNINTDVLAHRLLKMVPPVGLDRAEHSSIVWPAESYRHNVVDAIALARWLAGWAQKNPSKNINDFARL